MKNFEMHKKQPLKLLLVSFLLFIVANFLSCEINKNPSEGQNDNSHEDERIIEEQEIDETNKDQLLIGTWEVAYSKFINDGEMGDEMEPLAPTYWVFKPNGKMKIENTAVINATYELKDSVLSILMAQQPLVYKTLLLDEENMELRTIKQKDYDTETFVKLVKQ